MGTFVIDKQILHHVIGAIEQNNGQVIGQVIGGMHRILGKSPPLWRAQLIEEFMDTVIDHLPPRIPAMRKAMFAERVALTLPPYSPGRYNAFNRAVSYVEIMLVYIKVPAEGGDVSLAGTEPCPADAEMMAAKMAYASNVESETKQRIANVWSMAVSEIARTDPDRAIKRAKHTMERALPGHPIGETARSFYELQMQRKANPPLPEATEQSAHPSDP